MPKEEPCDLQGVENLWVDDPPVSGPVLKEVFKDLKNLLDDLFHWLNRLFRLIPTGHSAKGKVVTHFFVTWSMTAVV